MAAGDRRKQLPTDWGRVSAWYDQLVGGEGSEYHREVVLPGVMKLLGDVVGKRIVDVACGQGVLCRVLASAGAEVTGVDAAEELIDAARQRSAGQIRYLVGDVRDLSFMPEKVFDAATCILAIQNIHPIQGVFDSVARRLIDGGRFIIVMMHPCFRGAKEASWGWDEESQVQYRRVDRYLIPRKSPIFSSPGRKDGAYTWTFHKPIEDYVKAYRRAGLLIDTIEEWTSHRISTSGLRAAAENRARKEIPLFMAVRGMRAGGL